MNLLKRWSGIFVKRKVVKYIIQYQIVSLKVKTKCRIKENHTINETWIPFTPHFRFILRNGVRETHPTTELL